jgi:hypothetical protein
MTVGEEAVRRVLRRVAGLEAEAKAILSTHEASSSRLVTLEGSYADLSGLSLAQDELFRESLRAVETGLYRAVHVLAWAGFVDFLHEMLANDHQAPLSAARPKWRITGPEDLREWSEFGVVEAGKDAGVYNKTTMKALHGLLNRRNECAHPSEYFPDLNETLGYVGELFKRIKQLS